MSKKLILGVAFNDADYAVTKVGIVNSKKKHVWICPIYQKWVSMLARCYSKTYQARWPAYKGCSVCDDWLLFSNFYFWMKEQDWRDKCLDKDLLFAGNKIYSPETCCFIDTQTNNFLIDRKADRGSLMLGVTSRAGSGKFTARCMNPFTRKSCFIGDFKTEIEAHLAWKARKHEFALSLAEKQSDTRASAALMVRFK